MTLLFGEQIRPDLDPAVLLNELRNLVPAMRKVTDVQPVIDRLDRAGITVRMIDDLLEALSTYQRTFARLAEIETKLDRIDELITLLDQLDVITRRQ